MKTRAFKKVVSVVCVLAMLMSLCVVSFVGSASAAETYVLNNNGVTSSVSLNEGDALTPAPDYSDSIKFVGWYDKTFTTQYTTAGAEKNLYAKFSSTVIDFENGKPYYNPHEGESGYPTFGTKDSLVEFSIVDDPLNPGNKVLFRKGGSGQGTSIVFAAAPDVDDGIKMVPGHKYQLSFDYYITDMEPEGAYFKPYMAKAAGIGTTGNKQGMDGTFDSMTAVRADTWQHMSGEFIAPDAASDYPYISLMIRGAAGSETKTPNTSNIYIDNVVYTEITDDEREFTFYNKGEKTTQTLKVGDALPEVTNSSFLGWYDVTLTTKFDTVPATVTTLIAKYDGVFLDFETKGYWDPNNIVDGDEDVYKMLSFVSGVDPTNPSNHVMVADCRQNGNTMNFALAGAEGANAGLTLQTGHVYTLSFKYYVEGATDKGVAPFFRLAGEGGVGVAGQKANVMWFNDGSDFKNTNGEWKEYECQFTAASDSGHPDYKYMIFTVQDAAAADGFEACHAVMYFDDIEIKPYVPSTVLEDVVMDFENDFKWSVDGANDYTYDSGNGYVSRGEIAAEGDNHYFKVTDFRMKNRYVFFTVNDGKRQLEMANGGLYTVSFDYKVQHSETNTQLGLTYIAPTTANTGVGIATEPITVLSQFEYRDDTEWNHVEYSFLAEPEAANMSSLGIYLFNSTNVPIEYATVVCFDNIVVNVHSVTGEDSLIVFDPKGGDRPTSMTVPNGQAPEALPESSKYGYLFDGWTYEVTTGSGEDATVEVRDLTTSTPVTERIIHASARWKLAPGFIELNFRTNVPEYDAAAPTLVVPAGAAVPNMPADPTAQSYKFVGWYMDHNLTQPFNASAVPNTSTTLYAKWETQVIRFDLSKYPTSSPTSNRYKIVEETPGNFILRYDFAVGTSTDVTAAARAMLYNDDGTPFGIYEGVDYVLRFRYKVNALNSPVKFYAFSTHPTGTWADFQQQENEISVDEFTDSEWREVEIPFTAVMPSGVPLTSNKLCLAISGNAAIDVSHIELETTDSSMNVYGSAIRFNTNGGSKLQLICGEPGSKIGTLPTPTKSGYKFIGWCTSNSLLTPFTDTVFGEEDIVLHAKWAIGKYTEDFEDYPPTQAMLGMGNAYSLYKDTVTGFDPSNVHGGKTSLFRDGSKTGMMVFTLMRSSDYALTVGETYTVSFYVKPASIANIIGSISLYGMPTFTGINDGTIGDTMITISELKEGEWQQISYTFTAKSEFYGISTTDGNDLYFDDITVTLYGYTGSSTGDTSVNPLIILAMVIVSAGALLITGRKVFSK